MDFVHYSTAGKSGQQAGTVFHAAPYRSVVFTIRGVQETRDCSFRNLETPLRSISKSLQVADTQSGKPTAYVQPPMLVASTPVQGLQCAISLLVKTSFCKQNAAFTIRDALGNLESARYAA